MIQLSDAQKDRPDVERAFDIMASVCNAADIEHRELVGPRRDRRVAHSRQFSMWWIRQDTKLSLERIAKLHGRTDHSTVLHACRAVEQRLAENAATK